MQVFSCPFCGPRSEAEFHFVGDFPTPRPEGFDTVSADDWAAYLYRKRNPKGATSEIWMHMTCREMFRMERDTVTHEVAGTFRLDEEAAS